jgi:hypothetical protein
MAGRTCTVCTHGKTAEISKAISAGVSFGDVSSRFGVTKAAAHRHATRCLRLVRSAEKTARSSAGTDPAVSSRFETSSDGRCSACGLSATAADAESLMRRAERLLGIAEEIAAKAKRDDDARLALMAVDRARASLEVMMRASGMIGGDVTVNVVHSKRLVQIFDGLPASTLLALKAGECPHCQKPLLGDAEKRIDGQIGTPLREQKALNPA